MRKHGVVLQRCERSSEKAGDIKPWKHVKNTRTHTNGAYSQALPLHNTDCPCFRKQIWLSLLNKQIKKTSDPRLKLRSSTICFLWLMTTINFPPLPVVMTDTASSIPLQNLVRRSMAFVRFSSGRTSLNKTFKAAKMKQEVTLHDKNSRLQWTPWRTEVKGAGTSNCNAVSQQRYWAGWPKAELVWNS